MKKIVTGLGVPFLTMFCYYLLCLIFSNLIHDNNILLTAAVDITGSCIGLFVLLKFYRFDGGEVPDKETKMYAAATVIVTAFTGLLLTNYLMTHVFYDESFVAYSNNIDSTKTTFLSTVLTYAVTIFLAPLLEEIMFRGFIFRSAYELNPIFGYVMNIYLFVVIHGTKMHIPVAIAGGLILSRIYEKSRKIRYNVAAHMLYNFSATVLGSLSYPNFVFAPWFTFVMVFVTVVLIIMLFLLWNHDALKFSKERPKAKT